MTHFNEMQNPEKYRTLGTSANAVKAHFWKLLVLKTAAQQRHLWYSIDDTWSYLWLKNPIKASEKEHYVFIFRKEIQEPRKPFQLDLFSPNHGFYEYSTVVTNIL
jgi:hypothetical protein